MWAGRGGSWSTSAAWQEHVDEARDASTIYANVLDCIHLPARASAANGEPGGGDDIRGREPDEEQEHADNRDIDLLLHGPRVRPAGAVAVAPWRGALRSATGPVHAWREHASIRRTLLVAPFPVFGVEKQSRTTVRRARCQYQNKKGWRKPDVGHGVQVRRHALYSALRGRSLVRCRELVRVAVLRVDS